jgi:hypothetical protein
VYCESHGVNCVWVDEHELGFRPREWGGEWGESAPHTRERVDEEGSELDSRRAERATAAAGGGPRARPFSVAALHRPPNHFGGGRSHPPPPAEAEGGARQAWLEVLPGGSLGGAADWPGVGSGYL